MLKVVPSVNWTKRKVSGDVDDCLIWTKNNPKQPLL